MRAAGYQHRTNMFTVSLVARPVHGWFLGFAAPS